MTFHFCNKALIIAIGFAIAQTNCKPNLLLLLHMSQTGSNNQPESTLSHLPVGCAKVDDFKCLTIMLFLFSLLWLSLNGIIKIKYL